MPCTMKNTGREARYYPASPPIAGGFGGPVGWNVPPGYSGSGAVSWRTGRRIPPGQAPPTARATTWLDREPHAVTRGEEAPACAYPAVLRV